MASPLPIFVSHSHADNQWCRPFVQALHDAGIDVWYDEKGISGGAQWMATIEQELQTRDIFLLVLTPEAWSSEWVQRELQLALITKRVIIPVMLKQTAISGFLLTVQFIDATHGQAEETVRRVLSIIQIPATPGKVAPIAIPQEASEGMNSPISRLALPSAFSEWGYQSTILNGREIILPPTAQIPAGPFLMGTISGDSAPQCHVELQAFRIGVFAVTVAEYICAVRAKVVPTPSYFKYNPRISPGGDLSFTWREQIGVLANPVVGVTWYMAQDYAAWLNQLTGQPWRLPNEAEWEKAAKQSTTMTGTISNLSTVFVGAERQSFNEMPFNMIHNAWEWTSSQYADYPYDATDGREDTHNAELARRTARGGSIQLHPKTEMVTLRGAFPPSITDLIGFRLALG
jgi:formylglycine-generating enzyme required for sulfatase activity